MHIQEAMAEKELGKEYPEPGEQAIFAEMMREMKAQVDDLYRDKKMLRQVHTKMHGCVKAAFEIEPNLSEDLQVGVFQPGKTYHSWVRFSNASTIPKPDGHKDIRGLAIKLMGVPGEKLLEDEKDFTTQDFLLMSSETFFSKNVEEFRSAMKALTAKRKSALLLFFLNPTKWKLAGRMKRSLIECKNPVEIPYWSTQPFRFGAPDRAVKYFLKPSTQNKVINEDFKDDNYLRINLAQTLNSHEISFDFMVQFQTNADTMPIEDPTIPWSSSFQKLATLRIIPQRFDSKEQMEFGENLSFNPWHSLPEHKPLGSFNRARKIAYEGMSKYRHDKNGLKVTEPKDFDDFLQVKTL